MEVGLRSTSSSQSWPNSRLPEYQKHKVKLKPSKWTQLVVAFCLIILFCLAKFGDCDRNPSDKKNETFASRESRSKVVRITREKVQDLPQEEEDVSQGDNFLESKASESPHFEPNQADIVISSKWQNLVYLPCKILNLDQEQTVSWIRKGDSLVLTVDKLRLIDDQRFRLAQSDTQDDWTLQLSYPSEQDAGFYECQVSSMEPKLSRLIELRMIEASSQITAFGQAGQLLQSTVTQKPSEPALIYAKPFDQLTLSCQVEAAQQTDYIFWYKNNETLQYLQPESVASAGRKSGAKNKEAKGQIELQNWQPFKASSSIQIKSVQANDTAIYTCKPSNARASQVSIEVIDGQELNGGSQPEKRSLQSTDSARTNRPSLVRQASQLLGLQGSGKNSRRAQQSLSLVAAVIAEQEILRMLLSLVLTILLHQNLLL